MWLHLFLRIALLLVLFLVSRNYSEMHNCHFVYTPYIIVIPWPAYFIDNSIGIYLSEVLL